MERRENQRQLPSKWDKIFILIKSKFAFRTTPVNAGSLGDEQELLINGPPQKESSSTPNRGNSSRPALLQVEIQHDHSGSGKMIMVSEDVVDLKTVRDIPLGEPKPEKMRREWELNINDKANDFTSARE